MRTLLFSDIERSTALLHRAGAQYSVLLGHQRRIVRAAVERVGGIERGTEGDSFFITFDAPTARLAAAVEAQRALESYEWPDGLRLRVRMGFQAHHPDLQREFPLLRGVIGHRTNLPRNTTPFIGGEDLLEAIDEQCRVARVVALTGTA